jgi:glycosyltransferase involved in cell wall biosynthesis
LTARVSIVTPTLQGAAHLERTLQAVRAQTYANVEHIVVDGGSTDGTLDLLKRYEGSYDLRWISESDSGIYNAVNKGLRMASGEIVAYLNSDDLYFPWSVEVAVNALEAYPTADLVYGDAVRVDDIHGWSVPVFMPPFSLLASGAYGSLLQPVVFFRREVFAALGGFAEEFRYVADMDFWLRASQHFQFWRIPEFVALEQRHLGMLSETRAGEMAAEDTRMRKAHRRGVADTPLGRFAAYLGWHVSSARSWAAFARATAGHGPGWRQTMQACGPSVDTRAALLGLLPSKNSRLRSRMRWGVDPRSVATGHLDSTSP